MAERDTQGRIIGTDPKRLEVWEARIAESKTEKRRRVPDWGLNVDYRRGKPFSSDSDSDRIRVNFDWSATKAKQAQLFSQMPQVHLTPKKPDYLQGVSVFGTKLNDTMGEAGVGTAMDECLPDVINAAGVAAVIIGYETRGVETQLPRQDPMLAQFMAPAEAETPVENANPADSEGGESALPQPPAAPEMLSVPSTLSKRYTCNRISPGDLLWPRRFRNSDFDKAPWTGHSGRTTWSDAKSRFKLKDSQKPAVEGQSTRTTQDQLVPDNNQQLSVADPEVEYDEVFYWRYLYHPEETSFEALHHLVRVTGIDGFVVDEPWKGQRRADDGTIIGPCKSPIRYLTLTYLSDECIPPSDSAMGRPQVDELNDARTNQALQRKNSLPFRWMDVNRLDPLVQANMMRGTWQGIIPTNGSGEKVIGEIARAAYPNDHSHIEDIFKGDLSETWQVSPNQMGTRSGPAIRSAAEANITQANFQTRVGYERSRVVNFLIGIAEVFAGLFCSMNDFTPEEAQALAPLKLGEVSRYYAYRVWADATVLQDSEQRLSRLERYLNLTVKSGFVNPKPIIEEMSMLSGVDPATVVIDPQGPKDEPANFSLRGTAEDLTNPLVLAFLIKTGQAPSPQEIEAAKALLVSSQGPPAPPPTPGMPGMPGAPAGPEAAAAPQPLPPPTEDAHPDWNTASRIEKRSEDGK